GEAARSASQAEVAELVLTHIDSIYNHDSRPLLDDARKYYNGPISAATDLHQMTVTGHQNSNG
ncbi:MAG: hypothetical protein VX895_04025, partial [Chloroflexota bacterium]|nr:hypothetical protein [Chloroflexota bacterium]